MAPLKVYLAASLVVFIVVVLTVSLMVPSVQHPVSAHIVPHSVSQSVTNQHSGSSIPILNTAVQQEPSVTMTPCCTIARTPPAFGSSTSQNTFITGAEEGREEMDIEGDIEEGDMSNKGGDFAEDDDVNNKLEGGGFTQDDDADDIMENKEDFYESETVMHPPHHSNQTYPGSWWSESAKA
ncbi:hypothetical protein F4604DRAFT_1936135 [Suillus subluteus]|nr:hypothetical protein F4604DRAFT_1941169 [Suillus subluteus]KAG1847081.1 hypothetical protein F4604DRAFT_1936135 [Suillus subluteus]